MLGDLLKREQLCAAKPRIAFAGTTDPQRLHDVPEGVECHTHIGRMGHARGVRGLFHDSMGLAGARESGDEAVGILSRMLISLIIWDSIYRDHCHSLARHC